MVWTNRVQHRLNCRSVQSKCSCTEETQQVKGNMGWVLVDDIKKVGMESADPQNRSVCSACLRVRLLRQALSRGKQALKWI